MTLLYDRKWAQLTIKPGGDALKNHRKVATWLPLVTVGLTKLRNDVILQNKSKTSKLVMIS